MHIICVMHYINIVTFVAVINFISLSKARNKTFQLRCVKRWDVFRMGCWLRHGFMTDDYVNMFINTTNLVIFTGYISAFAFYQPKRVSIDYFASLFLIDSV